jgi:hypothetical protein
MEWVNVYDYARLHPERECEPYKLLAGQFDADQAEVFQGSWDAEGDDRNNERLYHTGRGRWVLRRTHWNNVRGTHDNAEYVDRVEALSWLLHNMEFEAASRLLGWPGEEWGPEEASPDGVVAEVTEGAV